MSGIAPRPSPLASNRRHVNLPAWRGRLAFARFAVEMTDWSFQRASKVEFNRIADLENGWSPQCLGRPAKANEWGVLKLGAVRFGVFDETENKALPAKLKPDPRIEVKQDDVIISRANILRLVGACAIVHATRPRLMLCDKIFRVVFFRQSSVLPEFLAEVLKTPSVRQQIEAGATGTSPTMKNISKPSLLDLVFPLPMGSDGLKVQARLIERLEKHRGQAAAKRTEAARLRSQAWADFLGAIFS
jgi:type I restriction enzyme S subunit